MGVSYVIYIYIYIYIYTTHYALAFMRTLTAFHSLKTAIKHISKDIVAPFKESSNNGNIYIYIYIYIY